MTAQAMKGRVALVTGASRGIGAATARKLAACGAAVAVGYLSNETAASATVSAIREAGGTAACFRADVSRPAEIASLVARVMDRFGRIDILVNNAGVYKLKPIGQIGPAFFTEIFEGNVLSTILLTQAVLPYLPSPGGRIINLSSRVGVRPMPASAVYAGSKAAVIAITEVFAQELGPKGITVNAVAPGMTNTEMVASDLAAKRNFLLAATPLGRIGEPEDIGNVIAFLASDDAGWMTGKTLIVDGGMI